MQHILNEIEVEANARQADDRPADLVEWVWGIEARLAPASASLAEGDLAEGREYLVRVAALALLTVLEIDRQRVNSAEVIE